jgi:sulfite reductase (NADPH) hemoprotein beta-component
MYRYDEFDSQIVKERVQEFRRQINMRLNGQLSENEFKPLRLMNGLYLQLHAYMLRVAIPYGTLSSKQLHTLAFIADTYDKGYGHFTTRQNIQFNWPKLTEVADILDTLADVEMHALQTSGNCIRNVTTDHWAGIVKDEIEDPRPVAELIRQWSTLHPEFSYLPRKFKIALTGAHERDFDRAAINVHDIGLRARLHPQSQEIGYEVIVGGGLGRTPMIGFSLKKWIAKDQLLSYLSAVMKVYNLLGRRDNKYKARIKILVFETGPEKFQQMVEDAYAQSEHISIDVPQEEQKRIADYFAPPNTPKISPHDIQQYEQHILSQRKLHKNFDLWCRHNLAQHKIPGYTIANISLKPTGGIPGDMSSEQMRAVATLAEQYSFSEIRVSHYQNLVLPYVPLQHLFNVWQQLHERDLAAPHHNTISDIIACPGLDYCSLATARSIPVAQEISKRFADTEKQKLIGPLSLNISGCINACGHHHVGHIGILGLDKRGKEVYQLLLGGNPDQNAQIGSVIGPGFSYEDIPAAVETVVNTYIQIRKNQDETFLETYERVGKEPFKEVLYGNAP